jgi:gas vesicle protein
MRQNEGIGAGALFVAFLAGAVAGAAVALLYAPGPGDETREYLGRRVREGRDKAADLTRQGREAVERQRESLVNAFDRARENYRGARDPEEEV